MTPVVLAMVAAVFIGAGAAWQQVVAAEDPGDKSMVDPRLLFRLLRRKKWLIGFAMANAGFACQASAIATGRLVLVEPIAATNVLFALLVSARHSHRRLGPREWRGAIFAIVGVGGFLALAAPKEGTPGPPSVPWFVPLAVLAVAVVVGIGVGATPRRRQPAGTGPRRAVRARVRHRRRAPEALHGCGQRRGHRWPAHALEPVHLAGGEPHGLPAAAERLPHRPPRCVDAGDEQPRTGDGGRRSAR